MNKFKILGIALIVAFSVSYAQDIDQVKKVIDAEKYEEAKTMLKSIIKMNPSNGMATFILGNVYLTQNAQDSAKFYFEKGVTATERASFNHIGLGQIDLDKNDIASATEKFAQATKGMQKKDFEEYIYIARAYMNISKPDYKKAITFLNRAVVINTQNAEVELALGDAYSGDGNLSDAYKAYRNAFQLDNTLLRAKMQLGVLLKGAQSYDEALKDYNEVIAINPNYGPVYRELAETYYKMARNKPSKASENLKTAIGYYKKYMSLTDYSIPSKMRYADFLILVKDYKTLEEVAKKLVELDKVNPRIYRYLGYSAYENGNIDNAIKSLEIFIANPTNKVIAKDFQYLGMAKIKKGIAKEGVFINATAFESGIALIKKSIETEPLLVEDLNDFGKALFTQKLYKEAAIIFELGTLNQKSKNYLDDNLYLGLALYYANTKKEIQPNIVDLQKADVAFDNVLTGSPGYYEAYLFKARTSSLLDNDPLTIKYYEAYLAAVSEKGTEELAKPVVVKKMIESYNTIGAAYANTDKTKAIDYFNKTLAIDATNTYALNSIKMLKK